MDKPAAATRYETPEVSALRYALCHIAHWPFDVNKTAEDDLREIKDFAHRTLEDADV